MNKIEMGAIPGNHHVKRALEVFAVVETVNLAMIGHRMSDCRAFQRTKIAGLGKNDPHWFSPCPCGCFENPLVTCFCDVESREFHDHRAMWRHFELGVEVSRPHFREINSQSPFESDETIMERVQGARERMSSVPEMLDGYCASLLEQAYDSLGLYPEDVRHVLLVSRAIAAMDSKERIEAAHLLEAVQYKASVCR